MSVSSPVAGTFRTVGGHRMHCLNGGAGAPVVMLHGNPTWSYYYRHLADALRDDYRVVVPDHVGCGLSDKPPAHAYPYTLRRRVEDLDELLGQLGVGDDVTLVLHDWGGMIGMAWAHRHPDRVRRLVLLNTAAFRLPPGKRFPWTLGLCRNPLVGPVLVRGLNAFCLAASRWCAVRGLAPEVRRQYLAPYDSWANRVGVLRFVQDIPLRPGDPSYELVADVEAGLHRFRDTPTLICWGAQDFVFDDAFLGGWRERLPQAEVHRFADAGHYVLEDARDRVIPLVTDFLARTGGG